MSPNPSGYDDMNFTEHVAMLIIHPCLSKQDTSSTILYYRHFSIKLYNIQDSVSAIKIYHRQSLVPPLPFHPHAHNTNTMHQNQVTDSYILDQCKAFTFTVFSHVIPYPLGSH